MWRLQHGEGRECELFRTIAEQGHYAGRTVPSDTRQGIYATTPSGVLLASANTREPRRIAALLETAIARWEATPETQRYLEDVDAAPLATRHERLFPAGGMILRVASRDLPRAPDTPDANAPTDDRRRGRGRGRRSWKRYAWNLDHAWFDSSEMRRFLPREPKVGATATLPDRLARRIARLHLVDNVRGQVTAFASSDVQAAEISTRIEEVRGDRIVLAIEGRTRAVSPGRSPPEGVEASWNPEHHERGVETTMLGRAVYDRRTDRFASFDLVALGTRWGGTAYNGREHDRAAAGIGFLLTLAGDEEARVAPAFVWEYGW